MWNRVKRLFRAVFGGLIDKAEDPELVLQQVIRDMRDKVPQMNENVAQVMATQKLLEKEVTNLEREITDLDAKIKAAIKQGRDDIAKTYISSLQEKQTKMQEQLAATMATFQVGDEASSFDEMRDKINRRAAAAEARMDLATTGVDSKIQDIEREAFNIQVDDTLAAYKRQLGVAGEESLPSIGTESSTGEKSLGPGERA